MSGPQWTWRRTTNSNIVHAISSYGGAACRRTGFPRPGSTDDAGVKCSRCLSALGSIRDYADYAITQFIASRKEKV
jgi:hypothetical protein